VGFITHTGDVVLDVPGHLPLGVLESKAFISQKDRLDLIDRRGSVLAQIKADRAETFVNDYCLVKVRHSDPDPLRIGPFNKGLVDLNGKWVVDPKFVGLTDVYEGFYAQRAKEIDLYSLVELNGKLVIPNVRMVTSRVSEGVVSACDPDANGVLGYRIARDGAWLIEPQFDQAEPFFNGIAPVTRRIKRKLVASFIDKTGRDIVSLGDIQGFQGGFSKDGLIAFCSPKRTGYMDASARILVEGQFDILGQMENGAAPVKADGKWGLIGVDGKWRRKPEFGSFHRQHGPFYSFYEGNLPIEPEIVLNPEGKTIWPSKGKGLPTRPAKLN